MDEMILNRKVWLTKPERIYVNKHCVFNCSKSKTINGGTPVQNIMYISITKGRQKVNIMIILYYYILNPEDVVIGRLFLLVFAYILL
jgi:hypothetical protein